MTNMKHRFWLSPIFALGIVFLVSCAQTPQIVDTRTRFREDAATDVVLHHYRWEHITVTRPSYREDGYLIQLSRETVGSALDRLQVKRDLAVVVFGWYFYTPEQLSELTSEWETLLRGQGFKRIVCVHGAPDKSTDGLPIIADTGLAKLTSSPGAGF
jgi:hypothetical protein